MDRGHGHIHIISPRSRTLSPNTQNIFLLHTSSITKYIRNSWKERRTLGKNLQHKQGDVNFINTNSKNITYKIIIKTFN